MSKQKARDHYTGKNSCPRFNCAQSVLVAFDAPTDMIDEYAGYGGGRAPGGWCGAAFAAARLMNDDAAVEQAYVQRAGSVKCTEIRKGKKLSCIGCVELGADLVHDKK